SDRGDLRLLVDPAETRVYVDGYYAGIVDDFDGLFQRLHVSPGRHEIALKLEGYQTHRIKVYVGSGSTLKIHYDMQKGTGETAEDLAGDVDDRYARRNDRYRRDDDASDRDRDAQDERYDADRPSARDDRAPASDPGGRRSLVGGPVEELRVDPPRDLGGAVAVAAGQEHHQHELGVLGRSVRREPAEARAGAGLSRHHHVRVESAGRAPLVHRAQETLGEAVEARPLGEVPALLGNEALRPLHLRLEHDAPVDRGREQHRELHGRGLDPLGVARQVTQARQGHRGGDAARGLAGQVDAGGLAQTEQVRVSLDLLVAEPLADSLA